MASIGPDFRGGWFRPLFIASNPAGLGGAIAIAAGLVLINLLLQIVFAGVAQLALFGADVSDPRDIIKAVLVGLFPASLLTAVLVWRFAKFRGGDPREVLNLRWPQLGSFGWLLVIAGFVAGMYAALFAIVTVFGIDLAQYRPGPHGESAETGSAGVVKEAMFDIANNPRLFALVLPSLGIGAPLAEELIFRGQIFTALSQTRLGFSGTTLLTSALWTLMHFSEPWLSVGVIFLMGLVLGWMLYRFGSLWVTIACHAVWNTTYALLIFAAIAP
ncbi:MAG: lysostaphin resistance A-like protein [Aestuariivirga sp.]